MAIFVPNDDDNTGQVRPRCPHCHQPGTPNRDSPPVGEKINYFCANPSCPAPQPPYQWLDRP